MWNSYELDLVNYQNKCRLIRGWDDLFNKVKEHINSVSAMKLSPYYKVGNTNIKIEFGVMLKSQYFCSAMIKLLFVTICWHNAGLGVIDMHVFTLNAWVCRCLKKTH